jgi:hypothetical protein
MLKIPPKLVLRALAATLVSSFSWLPALGQSPQSTSPYKLCFPRTTTPPNISGGPNDAGWTGAFLYVMGVPSGTSPGVTVRGIRGMDTTVTPAQDSLYFSIDASNLDNTLFGASYPLTLVVLAFDPGDLSGTADDAHVQRLHILPVRTDAAYGQSAVHPALVQYWGYGRDSLGVYNGPRAQADQNGSPSAGSPSWLGTNFRIDYYQQAGISHWYLAMKIPVRSTPNPAGAGDNEKVQIPASGSFGMYIDVFPVKSGSMGDEFWPVNWPPNTSRPTSCATGSNCTANTPVGSCTADCFTPGPASWGTSPVDGLACGGISIGSQNNDIFTNNTPVSKICIRPNVSVTTGPDQFSCPSNPNVFKARVHNTMIDGSGTPQTATGVRATFYITDWGITNSWIQIPVAGNPTPFLSVSPGNPTPFQTSPWVIPTPPAPSPNTRDYDPLFQFANPPSHPHQCVKVQLDSATGSNAVFLNNIAQQNMDFVNASKFQRNADISAKGYPPRLKPDGTPEADQLFDLRVIMHQEVLKPGAAGTEPGLAGTGSPRGKGGRVVSQLTWILEACRHTGLYMAVQGHKLEICEPVGSFGYVARHVSNAPIKQWKVKLTGIGLGSPTGNVYSLRIPLDGVATVNTSIEPEEQGVSRVALFLDAGAGIPHGTFDNFFNAGFSLNAGFEYIATSHFSAEGIFGYHRFPAKIGSALDFYQFSANGKFYLTSSGPLRPFVSGGIGGYKFSPGSTYFGGNFGGGILYELGPHWGLQASYNFHTVNTPGAATKFSTVQGGIRFVF